MPESRWVIEQVSVRNDVERYRVSFKDETGARRAFEDFLISKTARLAVSVVPDQFERETRRAQARILARLTKREGTYYDLCQTLWGTT